MNTTYGNSPFFHHIPRSKRPGRVVLLALAVLLLRLSADAATCVSAPAGLTAWWPGDGSARDIVGSNNGTLYGGATANAVGFNGSAFHFDGTNDYVQFPDSPVFHPANLSVEVWVNFDAYQTPGDTFYPNQQYIVFKQNSRQFEFEGFALTKDHDPQGDVFLWEVASVNGELVRIDTISTVVTGAWYHVVGVRGSNYSQLWMNGKLEVEASVPFAQDYGTTPLYFGTSGQSYYDRRMHGTLDEVGLYNRALSSNEIVSLYLAGSAGKCKGTNGLLISAQPQNQAANVGSPAIFNVGAVGISPITYQWRFDGVSIAGATSSNLVISAVNSSNVGAYSVLVANPAATMVSATAHLTILGGPSITLQPASQTALAGATVNFGVAATGSPPLSYQWQFGGLALGGQTGTNLHLLGVQPTNSGDYTVVITNSAGSVTSAVATLTVLVPPNITIQPTNRTVIVGGSVSFDAAANGTAPLSYQWQFNGAPMPGSSGAELTLGNVRPADAGDYAVVVTNSAGWATSSVATLTVLVPPSVVVQPADRTVLAGAAVSFSVAAAGSSPLSYQWQFNGTNLDGAVGDSLTLTNVQLGQAGNYRAGISNAAGTTNSAIALLTVVDQPVLLNARMTNGSFVFTLSGVAGQNYLIDVSTNLPDWNSLTTMSNANAQTDFTDSASSNSVSRFYRARWAP